MLHYIHRNTQRSWFERPEEMPEPLHQLLIERGIGSREEAERFLNPDERDLHDPMRLSCMAEAAAAVRAAMDAGEAICVYGDYDVDGVSASAILAGWLQARGADARVYLPSRHSEGYGLNEPALRRIAGWAKLLVTVDCGVTSMELVALAKQLGLKVVVTDHHRPAEDGQGGFLLPDCPVVNPLLAEYPFAHLCGAGVAWKLVWALAGRDAAMEYVDIAALATVADVVSLTGENRIIVKLGLERINAAPRPGVKALMAAAGLTDKPITSSSVAFQLAPRLNAGGRLGSAMRSYELLRAEDADRAAPLARELEAENTRRRTVELQILGEAEAQLEGFDFIAHRALILAGKDWNPGVIGLAASRLVEKYHYPVILLSDQGDRMTGSCRSIEGVDIFAALTGCAHALERFGGHRQAAGLTLRPERLEEFRAAMDAWLSANVLPEVYVPCEAYDTTLDFGEVTPAFIRALDGLQPTGMGNPAPVFRTSAVVVDAKAVGAEGAHLKLTLAQGGHRLSGIAFRMGDLAERLPDRVDALFVPNLNTFMGRTEPQLQVRSLTDADGIGVIRAKLAAETELQCEFLTQVFYNRGITMEPAEVPPVDLAELERMLAASPQGTLILTAGLSDASTLLRQLEPLALDVALGQWPGDPRAFNAVCACPPAGAAPRGYRNIVLAGPPDFWLPEAPGARILRMAGAPQWAAELPDVETMRACYLAVMRIGSRPARFRTLADLSRMAGEAAGVGVVAAHASMLAMADMGLFALDLSGGAATVRRSERRRAAPEESPVWRAMQRWRSAAV